MIRATSLLLLIAFASLGVLEAQGEVARPFSAAQAGRGQALALGQCAACHGARLEGRYGPPLSGPRFVEKWRGRGASELGQFIAENMPKGRGGGLSEAQTLELVAFILRTNGYESGEGDLSPERAAKLRLFVP